MVEGPALVNEPVVHQHVGRPVARDANRDPVQGRPQRRQPHERRDRRSAERHRVKVVDLEPAIMGLVMRAVPPPAPAVHDVFVHGPCRGLHQEEARDRHGGITQDNHQTVSGSSAAIVNMDRTKPASGPAGCRLPSAPSTCVRRRP